MTNILSVAIILVIVIGGTFYFSTQNKAIENQEDLMIKTNGNDAMMAEDTEIIMEGETMMNYSGATLAGTPAPLLDFAKADYDRALESDKLIVLYFYANWCPICKAEVAGALYPTFNELETDKVVGFRVNYNDNQTDADEKNLAREFGVAYQHTKVFVKDGIRLLKSPEGWDKARYLNEINKVISAE